MHRLEIHACLENPEEEKGAVMPAS